MFLSMFIAKYQMASLARQLREQKRYYDRLDHYKAQNDRCNAQMQLLERSVQTILTSDPTSNYNSPFSSKYSYSRPTYKSSRNYTTDLPQFKSIRAVISPSPTKKQKKVTIEEQAISSSNEQLMLNDDRDFKRYESKDSLFVAAGSTDRFQDIRSDSDSDQAGKYYIPPVFSPDEDEIVLGVSQNKQDENNDSEVAYSQPEDVENPSANQNEKQFEDSDSQQIDQKLQRMFIKEGPTLSKFSAVDTDSLSFGEEDDEKLELNDVEQPLDEEEEDDDIDFNKINEIIDQFGKIKQRMDEIDKEHKEEEEEADEVDPNEANKIINQIEEEEEEKDEKLPQFIEEEEADEEENNNEDLLRSDDNEEEEIPFEAENDDLYFSFEEDHQSDHEDLKKTESDILIDSIINMSD